MKDLQLIGMGAFTGFGMGQLSAWMFLHNDCPKTAGLHTLSIFGVGMTAYGILRIFFHLRANPDEPAS
jgi:hypothetical protein